MSDIIYKLYNLRKGGVHMIKSNLRVLLAIKEMSQTKLSELTGIRPATISSIVHNTCKLIPIHALDKMCKALECNVGDLFVYIESSEDSNQKVK